MSTYSDKIFKSVSIIIADASYLSKATDDDYCFIEDGEYDVYLNALGF